MPNGTVPAPPNRPAPGGLVALATRPDVGDVRWQDGFYFDPENCDAGIVVSVGCELPDEGPTDKAVPEPGGYGTYLPFAVVGTDQCSTLDRGRDRAGRARRHLAAVQSFHVEQVFWTGDAIDDPDDVERQHLADGNATVLASGAPVPVVNAVALLDQALTACLHGSHGMVHVTPSALVVLAAADLVHLVNGVWYTPNGHTVVPGSGYTGGGPRDSEGVLPAPPDLEADPLADQWIYGTGPVNVLLGDVQTYDDVERTINTETWRAEQPAAAYFGCCQVAVQTELDPGTS